MGRVIGEQAVQFFSNWYLYNFLTIIFLRYLEVIRTFDLVESSIITGLAITCVIVKFYIGLRDA